MIRTIGYTKTFRIDKKAMRNLTTKNRDVTLFWENLWIQNFKLQIFQ